MITTSATPSARKAHSPKRDGSEAAAGKGTFRKRMAEHALTMEQRSGSRIMAIINIMAFGCAVCLLSCRYRRRMEETLPVAVCVSIPVLYVFAMFGALLWVDAVSIVLLAATGGWLLLRMQSGRLSLAETVRFWKTYLLTPGLAAVLLLGVVLWYLTSVRYVYYSDDLCYWAVQVKSL